MGFLLRLGSLRVALTALAAINALYFGLVAFGNITDFDTSLQPALQNVIIAGVGLVLVHLPDRRPGRTEDTA